MRIGWFRSVSNIPHAFAIQSFVSELAHEAGRDPKDYLLDLIGPPKKIDPTSIGDVWNYGEDPSRYPIDTGRLRGVIEAASKGAGWGRQLPKGRGLGIAGHYSFVTYTAVAAEVEVDEKGQVKVQAIDIAVDCGPQVNPERIRSQMEGAVVMGMGLALTSEITFKQGGRSRTTSTATRSSGSTPPRRSFASTSSRAETTTGRSAASASPASRRWRRPSPTRSLPPPVAGSGSCRSAIRRRGPEPGRNPKRGTVGSPRGPR